MVDTQIKGTTPKYECTIKDSAGNVINPSTGVAKIVVRVYNAQTNNTLFQATTEAGPPAGYSAITRTSTAFSFVIPASVTTVAEDGDNYIEIWTHYTDAGYPSNTRIEAIKGILNRFIDIKDA